MKTLIPILFCLLVVGVIGNLAYDQRTPVPKTAAELFEALKLTEGQRTKFEALEEQRKQAQAKFKGLAGEALRKAQNDFYTERRKKLKEVFAEKQWTLWQSYWNRKKNAPSPDPESKPGSSVNLSTTSLVESTDLDRFGGWKAKQFDATGFFHTHHDGLRWWLVTPDGHPFLSFGLNHFHATCLHLLGIDHEQLTYRHQGRDFRLTDVHGHIVHDILA